MRTSLTTLTAALTFLTPAATAGDPPAPKPDVVVSLLGRSRDDVRRELGRPDRTGDQFDSFFKAGLAVDYDDHKAVKVRAFHAVTGDSFRGKLLGIGLGDTEAACAAAWGKPARTRAPDALTKCLVWERKGCVVEAEVWAKDGSAEGNGTHRAGTVRSLVVSREPTEAKKVLAVLQKYGSVGCDKEAPGRPVVEVTIRGGAVRDAELSEALAAAAKCPRLRRVWIFDTQATDTGLTDLRLLAGLEHLTALQLTLNRKVAGDSLKGMASLRRLRTLHVSASGVTDDGLKDLAALRELRVLGLEESRVTDAGLKHLAALKELWELDLSRTAVTDAGLKDLRALTHLRELDLIATRVTDAGLKELAALTGLRRLRLVKTPITGEGLKALAGLDELRELNLAASKVTDAGVKGVAALRRLERLTLDATVVTDLGLRELPALTRLQSLNLDETKVTALGVRELAALKELRHLSVRDIELTDAALKELGALKRLESLFVGLKLRHWKQEEALRKALPKTYIH